MDREKVINGLDCCLDVIRSRQFSSGCGFCPYISAEHCNEKMIEDAIAMLKDQEEKAGEWIPVTNGRGGMECSICHNYAPSYQNGTEYLSTYCPNCGAKMEGRQNE